MELETRIKIWEGAKHGLETKRYQFICESLAFEHDKAIGGNLGVSTAFETFPEAYNYEPDVKYSETVWFDIDMKGQKKRIAICNKVIKELKSQL